MCPAATWRSAATRCSRSAASIPIYLRAGDDVDVCWRLQARGWKIGFASLGARLASPPLDRSTAYWRQQVGYGEGERWLMAHHPEKFLDGHMLWRGRIYSPLPFVRSLWGERINAGVWGTAAFPSVYRDRRPPVRVPAALGPLAGRLVHPRCIAGLVVAVSRTSTPGRRRCCSAPAASALSPPSPRTCRTPAVGRRLAAGASRSGTASPLPTCTSSSPSHACAASFAASSHRRR